MSHWKTWGWDDSKPFLGDLLKFDDKDHLFVYRDELINRINNNIELSIETRSDGIFLLSGVAGVGKSTLLKYLIKKKYDGRGKRISLINTSDDVLSGNAQITSFQLLDILVQIDSQLRGILKKAGNNSISSKFENEYRRYLARKYGEYTDTVVKSEDFEIIQDLVTSDILPMAGVIQKMYGTIPNYVIAIDDVDYLSPDSQIKILSLLCMISQETINPKIIYATRPVAANIAMHSVATRLNHSIDRSIIVEPINPSKIIHTRMTECDRRGLINPFRKPEVEKFIDNISNGNIRTAIDITKKATSDGGKCISNDSPLFDRDCILSVLFGRKISSKSELAEEMGRDGYVPNIFGNHFGESRIPLVYMMLLTIYKLRTVYINESFSDEFNKMCGRINPKLSTGKIYSIGIVEEILWYCHKGHLISRTGFNNMEDYINYRSTHNRGRRNSLMYTKIEVTDRGKLLLSMSKEDIYQKLGGLCFYPRTVADSIIKMNFVSSSQPQEIA